jgi:hypothetical protein
VRLGYSEMYTSLGREHVVNEKSLRVDQRLLFGKKGERFSYLMTGGK